MQGDFIQTADDKRAINGYGSALLVKEPNKTLYSLTIALESVPAVFGSTESFEFNLLTAPSKGKVMGKRDIDDKEFEFLWHRDNVRRLQQLTGRILDFLVIYKDYTGYAFSGELNYRPNDTEADNMKGTITISPISVSEPVLDVRDLVKPTIQFANTIPDKVNLTATTTSVTINVTTNPDSNVTITAESKSSAFIVTVSSGKVTISKDTATTITSYGIIEITAADSTEMYAPWTQTVAVSFTA